MTLAVDLGRKATKQTNKQNEIDYSKTCLKRPLQKKTKMVFKTDNRLMQVKSIAECSPWSILQYF